MDQISVPEGVGLVGLLAILVKNYLPAIKPLVVALLSKAGVAPVVDDVGAVVAYNALADRLTESTAKLVWSEIQPTTEAKP